MGKWISRCVEKNSEPYPLSNTDNTDSLGMDYGKYSMDSISHSPALDHLTETEREAYREWFEIITTGKAQLSPEEAHAEAMKLLIKTSRLLKIDQAAQDYKLDGYIKIYSTKLNRSVYLAKDERAKRRIPDKSLQVFMECEIKALRGLSPDELMLILEAKAMLNFNGVIEDGGDNEDKG